MTFDEYLEEVTYPARERLLIELEDVTADDVDHLPTSVVIAWHDQRIVIVPYQMADGHLEVEVTTWNGDVCRSGLGVLRSTR